MLKKYIVFSISFVLLFSFIYVLSGMVLTYLFVPSIEEAWNSVANSSQEVVRNRYDSSFLFTLFIAFLSASIAYFIQMKTSGKSNQ